MGQGAFAGAVRKILLRVTTVRVQNGQPEVGGRAIHLFVRVRGWWRCRAQNRIFWDLVARADAFGPANFLR